MCVSISSTTTLELWLHKRQEWKGAAGHHQLTASRSSQDRVQAAYTSSYCLQLQLYMSCRAVLTGEAQRAASTLVCMSYAALLTRLVCLLLVLPLPPLCQQQVTGKGPLGALSEHLADPYGTTIFSKAVVVPGQAVAPPCAIPSSVQFQGITIPTPCFAQALWP